jgi:hypothetical protein
MARCSTRNLAVNLNPQGADGIDADGAAGGKETGAESNGSK